MRLIDANRLLKELNFIAREQFSLSDEYGKLIHTLIKVEELICEQPIIELVPCKDCVWFRHEITGNGFCEKWDDSFTEQNGYCHHGVRREK